MIFGVAEDGELYMESKDFVINCLIQPFDSNSISFMTKYRLLLRSSRGIFKSIASLDIFPQLIMIMRLEDSSLLNWKKGVNLAASKN